MKKNFIARVKRDFRKHKFKYLLFIPVLVYLILFCYKPMYGVVIAFQKYRPSLGIDRSPWVGLYQFGRAFDDPLFWRAVRNTFTISFLALIFSFPAPVLLALLLNEVRVSWFKRTVQTLTYMPHFIATVIVCGMITIYSLSDGLFSQIIVFLGGEPTNLLAHPEYFYPVYILSGVWQGVGWNSIIYFAAISGIDQALYEAAKVDGAGRFRIMWHITLPELLPTFFVLLVLSIANFLSNGMDQYYVFTNAMNAKKLEVLDLYLYNQGIGGVNYSYSTAVSMLTSVVGVMLLFGANSLSRLVRGSSVI